MKHRQSILLTSFAPMKPIVVTKECSCQTESEPLKTYDTIETQTEQVETASTRVQTENAETRDNTMQTASMLKTEVEIQTEKLACEEQEVQVNTFAAEMGDMECQTSDRLMQQSSEDMQSYESSEQLRLKGMPDSLGDAGSTRQGPPLINSSTGAPQTTRAANRPSFSFNDATIESLDSESKDPKMDRGEIKKVLTQSLNIDEAKKQRAAANRKKL